MTITEQFFEQSTAKLAATSIEPEVQSALEQQAAILVLSAAAYRPLSITVQVDARLEPTIEVWLEFEAKRRLCIQTSWPKVKADVNGPTNDTLLTSYQLATIISLKALPHSKAPELVKVYLTALGL